MRNTNKQVIMAMLIPKQIALYLIFALLCQSDFKTFAVNHNQSLYLDSAKNYYLSWTLDNEKISFLVRVNTSGYVGFGLSPNPNMIDSDIFIGGVKDGDAYFGDYYALANNDPIRDDVNNWNLISYEESNGQTILKFWRNLSTGDSRNDNNITDKETYIIWAYGQTDDIVYHRKNRGSKSVSFLQMQTSSTAKPEEATQTQKSTTDGSSGASVSHWYLREFSIIIVVTMINIFI